jgi:hypothetical protein
MDFSEFCDTCVQEKKNKKVCDAVDEESVLHKIRAIRLWRTSKVGEDDNGFKSIYNGNGFSKNTYLF